MLSVQHLDILIQPNLLFLSSQYLKFGSYLHTRQMGSPHCLVDVTSDLVLKSAKTRLLHVTFRTSHSLFIPSRWNITSL